ncbi:hypothetical protein CHS0354_035002 [Potamilus streckersoni]|uniref:Carboxylesterase type B domain-containing protein n=1 Tax=Potamilus streckersoni TaxID=2493646 RepID=A0AAE0SDK7_9BIVA|nr:hypothetical protein CHS0354_035002 [Potamilus streckersoni]
MEYFRGKCFVFMLLCCITNISDHKIIRQFGEKIVETKYGRLQGVLFGFYEEYKVKSIYAFFCVPYASLRGIRGHVLRFMPPSSSSKWKYLRDASKQNASVSCQQKRLDERELEEMLPYQVRRQLTRQAERFKSQDEDCLSLNINVPNQEDYL